MTIELFFRLLGSLALLIYGMKMMSDALQKMAGPSLRHILARMTGNRFSGMLTGTMVTCAVQSSSATTVMTVSFVSAGLLTLAQAISVIMGANIGTTLTAWIMSLGYNLDLTAIVFPAFLVGMVLIYKKRHRVAGDFLFGIAFLFWSLVMLSSVGRDMDLAHNASVVVRHEQLSHHFLLPCCRHRHHLYCAVVGGSDGYHHTALLYGSATHLYGYSLSDGREHWNDSNSEPCSSWRRHRSKTRRTGSPAVQRLRSYLGTCSILSFRQHGMRSCRLRPHNVWTGRKDSRCAGYVPHLFQRS